MGNIAEEHNNLKIMNLKPAYVSLSKLRNIGIEEANGKYITFLEDDYGINFDNLLNMLKYANIHDLDYINGYIKVVKDNRIEDWDKLECENNNQLDVIKNNK